MSQKTNISLNSVTASATGTPIWVGDAKRIAILLRRSAHGSGSSAFTVFASTDPIGTVAPVMTAYSLCIDNATNTNGQNLTRVAGKTLAANGDAFLFIDNLVKVNWLGITVVRTTDGTAYGAIITEE